MYPDSRYGIKIPHSIIHKILNNHRHASTNKEEESGSNMKEDIV
jgi:hypothetical protein